MQVTISNIAWTVADDLRMYELLQARNIRGLEIAPTRIFGNQPYDDLNNVATIKEQLKDNFNLNIISLQSICFGVTASIFENEAEKDIIKKHLKKAIDFAAVLDCPNLVFGSPKNRIIKEGQYQEAVSFFSEIGEYAHAQNTILAIEPNPKIYGTNFINTTKEAIGFLKDCQCRGLKINYDFGTVIENGEDMKLLTENPDFIHHVHISEPYLEPILKRSEHKQLAEILKAIDYRNYVSIEMKNGLSFEQLQEKLNYIQDVFQV
ncbi:sugar phosphate isomerase/epimerase family protein [Flavobacterium enshiense]|uniref:sugar phosphate isomerase/epimerase family protein n=1 Tax=Flavobacterium enshiense TaxID=1341165 RepID=UPI00345D6158